MDSVQISLQSDESETADLIAGVPAHAAKVRAARLVRELGLPLTINVVVHRYNIDRVADIIRLAECSGALPRAGECPILWLGLPEPGRTAPEPVAGPAGRGDRRGGRAPV